MYFCSFIILEMKWLVLILIILLVGGFYMWEENKQVDLSGPVASQNIPRQNLASESASFFEELTIPYLRSRSYASQIGERVKYQSKQSYQSYLTSYVSDGLKINGLLTIPVGQMPEEGWPAIVFVHGYIPPTLYKTTEKYVEYVDYLARSGFVVFKIDLRGHGQSEGEPGGAYYSSDYVIDVLNAYRALEGMSEVNKRKVYMWGHSMAGNVLFRAAVVQRTVPKVVIWAGAVYSYADFAKYGISDNSYRPAGMSMQRQRRRQQIFDTYGPFSGESDFWKKVSPVNYLEGVKTEFQVHHAVDDGVVNVGYSRDLVKLLGDKSVKVDYLEYKSGGHNISGPNFGEAMAKTVEFLKR